MYASFSNHFTQGWHYAFGFLFLYWLWPKLLFVKLDGDSTERATANFIRMVLLMIVICYILVVTKLLEVTAIILLLLIWAIRRWIRQQTHNDRITSIVTIFFDFSEGKIPVKRLLYNWLINQAKNVRQEWKQRLSSPRVVAESLLLLVVLVGAIYVRFYDPFMFAPPGMSDGNVTLLWMKFLDDRLLFEGGIYPQGFHIYLDTLYKFSAINAVYVLKYTGPLNAILTMLGMHFAVSRFTGNRIAGVAAAAVYGWFGATIGSGWERQAATNSQEFAMVFLFPALYFYYRYLLSSDRRFFWTASAGLIVTGLVHTLIFGFLCLGIAVISIIFWIGSPQKHFRQIVWNAASVIIAAIASVIPAGVGLILGSKFQTAAQGFLVDTSKDFFSPALRIFDFIALVFIVLLTLAGLILFKNTKFRITYLFAGLFAGSSFIIYFWGGLLIHSTVITTRASELWSLSVPFCIGMGWGLLVNPLSKMRFFRFIEILLIGIILAMGLYLSPLKPIVPYKMEWSSSVEQILKISKTHRPKTWNVFSQEEGYALIEGSGYHGYISDLLEKYDPTKKYLTLNGKSAPDDNLARDVYIYEEKQVYRVDKGNSIYPLEEHIYNRREQEMIKLAEWIKKYKEANGSIEIYFEDEHLRIYHINRPLSREEAFKKIWE